MAVSMLVLAGARRPSRLALGLLVGTVLVAATLTIASAFSRPSATRATVPAAAVARVAPGRPGEGPRAAETTAVMPALPPAVAAESRPPAGASPTFTRVIGSVAPPGGDGVDGGGGRIASGGPGQPVCSAQKNCQ